MRARPPWLVVLMIVAYVALSLLASSASCAAQWGGVRGVA